MRRVTILCAAMVATSWALASAVLLPPGEVIEFGKDTFQLQELTSQSGADARAKKVAKAYCKKLHKVMVVKDIHFTLDSAELVLTFTCVSQADAFRESTGQ